MKKWKDKVQILVDSLPYIREFQGKNIVIKYGGSAMIDDDLKQKVIDDIILLKLVGVNPIIVHGGGNKISELLQKLGKTSVFVDGLRVTDKETVEITEMVLTGLINKEIVSLINRKGGSAIGLSGKDGRLIVSRKKPHYMKGNKKIDHGFVGDILSINTGLLQLLEQHNFIPVISPIGFGENGDSFNLNADTVAGFIASYLKAEKLVLLTDVAGVLDAEKKLISSVSEKQIKKLIKEQVIAGGMLPKIEAGLYALEKGVKKVHIIDGRIEHSLLLELFTSSGIGTEIVQ